MRDVTNLHVFQENNFHCKTPIKHMLVFVRGTLSKKTDLAKTF